MQRLSNDILNVTVLTKSLDGSEELKVIKSYTKDNDTDVIIKWLVPITDADSEDKHPTCKDCEYFQSSVEPCECSHGCCF